MDASRTASLPAGTLIRTRGFCDDNDSCAALGIVIEQSSNPDEYLVAVRDDEGDWTLVYRLRASIVAIAPAGHEQQLAAAKAEQDRLARYAETLELRVADQNKLIHALQRMPVGGLSAEALKAAGLEIHSGEYLSRLRATPRIETEQLALVWRLVKGLTVSYYDGKDRLAKDLALELLTVVIGYEPAEDGGEPPVAGGIDPVHPVVSDPAAEPVVAEDAA